jgi:hypothetical protein
MIVTMSVTALPAFADSSAPPPAVDATPITAPTAAPVGTPSFVRPDLVPIKGRSIPVTGTDVLQLVVAVLVVALAGSAVIAFVVWRREPEVSP